MKAPPAGDTIAMGEIAALMLRTLMNEGVPAMAAVSITTSYIQTLLLRELSSESPDEPWKDRGT